MSQKISPVSLRLSTNKGFRYNVYVDTRYIQIWNKSVQLVTNYKQIIENYGILKLKRNQINRRLRLKHSISITSINNLTNYILSIYPYKNTLNSFLFKKPLAGVQRNYSIRPMQKRKNQVYVKK